MTFRTIYGNTYSENGWRMCDRNECDIPRIPNLFLVDTAPLRKGAPLTILGAWLKWYDVNVEEILSPVWGWSATNTVANSNHLAGASVDVNAPKYPMGYYRMPSGLVAKVNTGLELFGGSVYWGRRWNTPDEMHFQMAWREGDARNDAFAAKLRAGYLGIYGGGANPAPAPNPAPSTSRPTLRRGDTGEHVRYLQDLLNRLYASYSRLAVDGDFGPATENVVRQMQGRIGIGVDGIVGPATWRAMGVK
ncbi:D-alanyl-D-alanine carboxypeptidase [Rhodococcus erythropolis]|uniref:peptidoglycan-binding protein n=1 Tax=Rhodococcus erythropolis TaxID=1833 RepID=UPI000876BB72|nr:peptidoglycan-binding protein [Rhodococcus erythropolis]SCZ14333.1 D-alanyl-D-alanine carboxypeptidase [Rhodococcus erythropolis]